MCPSATSDDAGGSDGSGECDAGKHAADIDTSRRRDGDGTTGSGAGGAVHREHTDRWCNDDDNNDDNNDDDARTVASAIVSTVLSHGAATERAIRPTTDVPVAFVHDESRLLVDAVCSDVNEAVTVYGGSVQSDTGLDAFMRRAVLQMCVLRMLYTMLLLLHDKDGVLRVQR